jgi:hypothetical protein
MTIEMPRSIAIIMLRRSCGRGAGTKHHGVFRLFMNGNIRRGVSASVPVSRPKVRA